MQTVFADTSFWLARVATDDPWRLAADRAFARLRDPLLITSDYVLVELLNALSNRGSFLRQRGVNSVLDLENTPEIEIVESSHARFVDALDLYRRRADKGYSLTDCASMIEMRRRGIRDVLTSDRHFEQEGFTILMK